MRPSSFDRAGSARTAPTVASVSRHSVELPRFCVSLLHTDCRISAAGGEDMPELSRVFLNCSTRLEKESSVSPTTNMFRPGTKLRITPGSITSFAE